MNDLSLGVLKDRFSIQHCLGKGGFGVVYQAHDHQRNIPVALKVLRRSDAEGLYRLKREFRALADLAHPNLVSLYELLFDGGHWLITMELIEGVDFVTYVWNAPRDSADGARASAATSLFETNAETGSLMPVIGRDVGLVRPALDVARMESATRQLAQGLHYLHSAGKLHRDIKPSNVLVTAEGRLVLLDFGLVEELTADLVGAGVEVSGTPAYMAPEQAIHGPMSAASDWYSVGVVMFEALTGRLAYTGTPLEILQAKCERDAPAPSELADGIPEALNDLCRDLLARSPGARPSGAQVLARLGAARVEPWLAPVARSRAGEVFVGRGRELALLGESFETVKAGRPVTVYVHGGSGMGKSILVRYFLQQLTEQNRDAVVLTGRCYEREAVPYKALDSLVDSLTRHLSGLPRAEVEALLPRDVLALARLFPVLRRVEAIAQAKQRGPETPDSQEFRRRAFAAFRELMARMSDRHPVVLFIDDLQWGDADSAALLADLLSPPHPPVLLLLASYRSEEAASSVLLRRMLRSSDEAVPSGAEVREVIVGQLAEPEARELALTLIGASDRRAVSLADDIVRESGGSAFFIDELVRYSQSADVMAEGMGRRASSAEPSDITLDTLIERRVAQLPSDARKLLEILAVFGGALDLSIASRVADSASQELVALSVLRAARLARTRLSEGRDEVEIYHDRIRETIVRDLPAASLRGYHERLALGLEDSGTADPETLALHFHGAGLVDRAAEYAIAAADRAAEAVAFDRAARLYRLALDLRAAREPARRRIQSRLGDALANAGRGHEAADAYVAASEGALAAERLELRRRAAEQLLQSGHIDEGFRIIRDVLSTVGLKLASSPRQALLSLLVQRARIKLRGLQFHERDRTQVSAEALVRVDTCWSVATGLAIVDYIRAAEFQARHLLLALRTGEPYRIVRALAMEIAYGAIKGVSTQRRNEELLAIAERVAAPLDQPEALALVTLVKGSAAYMQGRWAAALQLCEDAEVTLRGRCTGVAWQLDTAQFYTLLSLFYVGELKELSRRLPILLKEARERDGLYAATNLRTRISYIAWLAADDPEQAAREVRRGIERWSHQGFHIQHYYEMLARAEIRLYSGNGAGAWTSLDARWSELRRSFLLRIQPVLIESLFLRARAALAAAVESGSDAHRRAVFCRLVERDARDIARQDARWAEPIAQLLQAGLAATSGRRDEASTVLRSAVGGFMTVDMGLYAAVARRRLGELAGGSEGDALVRQSDEWMAAQAIRHPARMTAALVPGEYGSGARRAGRS